MAVGKTSDNPHQDSSSFIAVTATPECAKTLVCDSPYQRILHVQDSATVATSSTAAWGAAYRSTITDPINIQPLEESDVQSNVVGNTAERGHLGLKSKLFTIRVFPGNADYNHKRTIGRNQLHGPWPQNNGYSTFTSNALARSVPRGYMSPGLRDWETGHQLSEESVVTEDEGAQALLGQARRKAFFPEERKRKNEVVIPDVMKSLAAVAGSAGVTVPEPVATESSGSRSAAEGEDTYPSEVPEVPQVSAGEEAMAGEFAEEMPTVDEGALWNTLSCWNVSRDTRAGAARKTAVDKDFRWDQFKSKTGKSKTTKSDNGDGMSPARFESLFRTGERQDHQQPTGAGVSETAAGGFVWDLPQSRQRGAPNKSKAGKSSTDDRVTTAQFEALFNGGTTQNSSATADPSRKAARNTTPNVRKSTKQSKSTQKSGRGKNSIAADERLSPDKFQELFRGP